MTNPENPVLVSAMTCTGAPDRNINFSETRLKEIQESGEEVTIVETIRPGWWKLRSIRAHKIGWIKIAWQLAIGAAALKYLLE